MRNVAVLLMVGFVLLLATRLAIAIRPTAAIRERFLANRAALLGGLLVKNGGLPSAVIEVCHGAEHAHLFAMFGNSTVTLVEHGARASVKTATLNTGHSHDEIAALRRAMDYEAALYTQIGPFEPPAPGYAVAYRLSGDKLTATSPIPISDLATRTHPLARAFAEARDLSRKYLYRSFG
jgi:hypothetical protein